MSGKLTQEQIARQFELPERKSKIATLLKQDGQAYCICRSSDSSRFMIGCDACEEWYHGDCIGINQKEAKHIKRYFCDRCHEEDPSLVTVFKSSSKNVDSDYEPPRVGRKADVNYEPPKVGRKADSSRHHISNNISKKVKKAGIQPDCGHCTACIRTSDCGSCRTCRQAGKHSRNKCLYRICKKKKNSSSGGSGRYKQSSTADMHSSCESEEGASAAPVDTNIPQVLGTTVKPGMQCYGPGCVQVARPNSKYCSDKCGLALATCRILQVLPQRVQEWSMTPTHAEEMNKKELEIIRKKQEEARAALQELDKKYQELDALVERAKRTTVPEEYGEEVEKPKLPKGRRRAEEGRADDESSIYCVTCGHEIHTSTAIKHLEKCFNKYESQTSFGSIYKTRIEGNNMFCDFYNPANKTYCKRLKVLCPEHNKEPKISPTEVCGFPFVKNVFEETGEICKYPKKSCSRHHCWEKLRRAEIDMERVRQWLKIDELLEQERQIRAIMSSRAGVVALMLHSTFDHEAMVSLSEAQQHGQPESGQN
ncbi:CXXC-type zinc finger protein 1-like isoform X2 [Rhodnius prolixus]|uniref:CXXC-type zinc finger protein 1-like isoform X2 n=1 Tax=Rhodnius prolixus TaxID=13249 RepID=UPI003D18AD2E